VSHIRAGTFGSGKGKNMALKAKDLSPEMQTRFGLIEGRRFKPTKRETTVPQKVVILGKVLVRLQGLTRRDTLWVLRRAAKEL
jgi:hypothetical protein